MMICLLEMVIEGIVSGNEPVLDQNLVVIECYVIFSIYMVL